VPSELLLVPVAPQDLPPSGAARTRRSASAAVDESSTHQEVTPIPAPQRKPAPKPIPHGDSTAIRSSIDAAALENSGDDEVDDEGGFDYFGDMPNPDPEDVSPRDLCGNFILLFAKSKKIAKDYSKDRKVRIFYDALTVDKRTILGDSPPKDVKATFELWQGQVKNRYRWNLDRIVEAVFVVSKHASNHQEMNVQRGGAKPVTRG
jgi:hypothetical protein